MCIFITISRRILLRRKNFRTQVAETIETHILRPITFFLEHRVVHVIVWKNVIEQARPCRSCDSVEERDSAGQAIDENIKWACALPAGYLKLQTRSKNLLLFHSKNGYVDALSVSLYVQSVLANVKLVLQKAATGPSSVVEENCSSWNRQEDYLFHLAAQIAFLLVSIRVARWLEYVQYRFTTLPTAERHSTAACADDRHVTPNTHTR